MNNYDYYSDWCEYTYNDDNQPATDSDIREKYRRVELKADKCFAAGGVPLLVDNGEIYVNDLNENMIIFGETGCKKTRAVIAPLIMTTAGAGESALITDVKGELSSNVKLRGWLKDKGVKTVTIDFRTFDADGINLLEQPFAMYRNGHKDKALSEVNKLLNSLASKYKNAQDPFWADSAVMYLLALTEIMFVTGIKTGDYEKVNMLTLSMFANLNTADELKKIVNLNTYMFSEELSPTSFGMLKSVIMNPADRTLGCIMNFVQSMLQPFIMDPKLAEMLSRTTFDIKEVYDKPTFIFLVVPDETSTYDSIAGLLTDTFYTTLVSEYSTKYMNKSEAPCRMNFICDEFCNMNINDMKAKISASRGRNMRWFIVCQSKDQLEKTYNENAGTIIGNCRNTLFLQSCDKTLIDYVCGLCGDTEVTERGGTENMVTPYMLRSLKKERAYKEALFIDGNTVYFAKLPDIDSYDILSCYGTRSEPRKAKATKSRPISVFTPEDVANVFCDDDDDIYEF